MKPNKFSLASVLGIELQLEQVVEIRLSRARHMLDLEIKKLQILKSELIDDAAELISQSTIGIQMMQNQVNYANRIKHQIDMQNREIHQRQQGYDNILREKIHHSKRIEGLRKLKKDESATFELEFKRHTEKSLLDAILAAKR